MNSVVSAAIIEGNLIIGLSDGSIINCGFVQGPQGLSGPQGPMGATGDNGTDGNTIITVGGTPGNEMGSDGDYAIDNINWRIYGPKSGGVWGKAKEMLPGPENILENGRAPSGGSGGGSMGGSGSGGGGGIIYTNTVQLTNPVITLLRSTANYKIIPNAPAGTTNQQDANLWGFGSAFDNFDAAIPVPTGVLPPNPLPGFIDNYDGRLWFNSSSDDLTLYVYKNKQWVPTFPPITFVNLSPTPPVRPDRPDGPNDGDLWFDTSPDELTLYVYSEDSGAWIPAAPPTTLEGRVAENEALQIEIVQRLQANEVLTNFHSNEIQTIKHDIIELEEEIDAIAPASERGTWAFNPVGNVSLPGAYTMYTDFRDDGLGNVASIFATVKNIALNEKDLDNTVHNFGGTEEGDLLEIFEENDADYGLYSIVSIEKIDNPNPGGITYSYISIDVNLERTGSGDSADSRARFKVFKAPEGGDASAFVQKSGDNMEGTLDMEGVSGRNKILNLAIPTSNYDAANKIYVDNRLEGVVGRYIVKDVSNSPVSSNGHMGVSTSFYAAINQFSFGAKDLDGGVTKQLTDGDIIETFDTGNNKTNRFKVTDASNAPSVVKVEFVSGNSGYSLQDVYQVQIYPGSGGEGEYVLKAGDNMEGQLSMQGQGGRNKIIGLATPTSDYHAANKTYVDDKIAELLAKIEELEMTSGTTKSYQFQMYNNTAGSSTSIGSQIFVNQIMSCDNDGDNWNGQNTHFLTSEHRHIYVCFEDGYQLNSTGQMSVMAYSSSTKYDRTSNIATYSISGVEVCPPDKSSGKNIYRAVIQLDAYKPQSDSFYPSWNEGYVYVTFSGGSLSQTSA
jgi:hypothetical protein